MRRVALLLVLMLVVAACSPQEEELRGLRNCGELELEDDFGNTRDLDGADVVLFSRPGRYDPREAVAVSGLDGDVRHVARVVGPCGQQDLFLSLEGGALCVSAVGRSWEASTCWDDLQPPVLIPLEPSESFGGVAFVVWAPGPDPSHALAETASVTVGAFLRDGISLVVLPEPPVAVAVVDYDGERTAVNG